LKRRRASSSALRAAAIGLVACQVAWLGLATPAQAQNPPVIYVHGVTEDACEPNNLRVVLNEVGERLPQADLPTQGGRPCPQTTDGENPLRFRYVQDKEGARDRDKADRGSSQSGARRNATALHDYIDRLAAKGQKKVMLVGFSMGGLVLRTYLADHPEHAEAHVAGAVFIESAIQGSWAATVPRTANARETRRSCEKQRFPGGSAVCFGLLRLARDRLELPDEDAIAFRDLSPGSEIVRSNADAEPPSGPRYLTVPGDIRLRLPRNLLAEWRFGRPGDEVSIGDGFIPLGTPDPAGTPALGGASFKPDSRARQSPLVRTCGVQKRELQSLVDAYLAAADTADIPECVLRAPEAHWNINAHSAEAMPGRVKNLPKLVGDFLVETCNAERLGRCAPEPLVGAGGICGLLTSLKDQNNNRPLRLELQVERGAARCSEARELVTSYWTATGPCDRQGAGTCWRESGEWECVAPTLGSYPVIVSCFGPADTEIQAIDTEAYPVVGSLRSCEAPPALQPAPFAIRANIKCAEAVDIATQGAEGDCGIGGTGCDVRGFTCATRSVAIETSETNCVWGPRRVTFKTGA